MLTKLTLLAEDPIYVEMGRNFRSTSDANRTVEVVVFTLAIATIISLMWFIHRRMEANKSRQRTSPDALFAVLCKAHRLKWRDRRCLRDFAKVRELPHPSMVFVAPERMSDQELLELDERNRDRIVEIRSRLFGSDSAA